MRAETKQMANPFMVFMQESPSDDCTVLGFEKNSAKSVYPDSQCSSRTTLLSQERETMTAAFFHDHDWRASLEIMVECEGGRQVRATLPVDGFWAAPASSSKTVIVL